MRTPGTRRTALVAGVATVAAVALAACSSGQVAETALKNPSVYGVNTQNSDGSVLIRNLAVAYPGPSGFESGANAPLEVNLYNKTAQEIKGTADAKSTAVYSRAYGKDPDFYQFWKAMETLKESLDEKAWLILSTDSELLKYLKSAGGS